MNMFWCARVFFTLEDLNYRLLSVHRQSMKGHLARHSYYVITVNERGSNEDSNVITVEIGNRKWEMGNGKAK
jgi:hypothetical protein